MHHFHAARLLARPLHGSMNELVDRSHRGAAGGTRGDTPGYEPAAHGAFTARDANAVSDALKRRGELERQVQRLETQWFELQSEMDAIV